MSQPRPKLKGSVVLSNVRLTKEELAAKSNQRIANDIKSLREGPPPFPVKVGVDENNLHVWHFCIPGPEDSPYAGGTYVMRLDLPPDYPMSPPDIQFLTPSGRFTIGQRICVSFTGYHAETWSPAYTMRSLLISMLSFMADDEHVGPGSMHSTVEDRRAKAAQSAAYNTSKGYDTLFQFTADPGT